MRETFASFGRGLNQLNQLERTANNPRPYGVCAGLFQCRELSEHLEASKLVALVNWSLAEVGAGGAKRDITEITELSDKLYSYSHTTQFTPGNCKWTALVTFLFGDFGNWSLVSRCFGSCQQAQIPYTIETRKGHFKERSIEFDA